MSKPDKNNAKTGADLLVESLEKHDVPYIFGIPGAKIDGVFDVLKDRGPEVIVCRHEQNAAFMAAAVGRLTDKPGVCLVTSGPGAANLATGLVTATAEGDPVVALAGAVPRGDRAKNRHQSMDNEGLFKSITKFSVEVEDAANVSEVIADAFRKATSSPSGAAFVSLPQDVMASETSLPVLSPLKASKLGAANKDALTDAVQTIRTAKLPVLLLGMRASQPQAVRAIRTLLSKHGIPVVETFQGAGALSRDLESNFFGRVGLFRNQPGDVLLKHADVVVTIGYDPIEYPPSLWNKEGERQIVHVDDVPSQADYDYQPTVELWGDISSTVDALVSEWPSITYSDEITAHLTTIKSTLQQSEEDYEFKEDTKQLHPLQIIDVLQQTIDDNTTVACDIGSLYIWMARYFRSYKPQHLLFTNGMQTLGVALPWGIAASLVRPHEKVLSMSGDGGFLFSAMELETAVRLNLPIVHIIWNDQTYDMVGFQQQVKYNRKSAVEFGNVDFVKFAESFGAKGFRVHTKEEFASVLKEAFQTDGPVVIDVPVDYKDNEKLNTQLLPDQLN
ncbi:acetolactate synthase AlsS [Priestia koreensis]|uniref:acetolactate synthase AlsS n=1 Tax=Priestia koreensis TaxID=284581 RepID=UPI0020409B4D|nr:acetolactate synthase AlsS [Priestia koreensis]MCM3004031.1 acetolactate synthase AlsS [Priestia koreensis]